MHTPPRFVPLVLAALALASPAWAIQQAFSLHARQYTAHAKFEERPFDDGNFGYGLAYELRDTMGYWQLGARYIPNAGADNEYDYVVTPFLNVVFRDRIFLGGFGLQKDYLPKTGASDADWTDLYYNFILGLGIPLGPRMELQALAFYDFDQWGNLVNDFELDEVEFGVALAFLF